MQRRMRRSQVLAQLRAERRLAEERFRTCYERLPLSTVTWQRQGEDFVLVSFNEAAERLTQGGVVGLRGMAAKELFAARPDLVEDIRTCLSSGNTRHRESPYQLVSTGETRDLALSYVPLPPDLVVVHMEDVTALRTAEREARQRAANAQEEARRNNAAVLEINERLRRALLELEAAQTQIVQQERLRALGEMASGIAHDLNNALAPVVGDLLRADGHTAEEVATGHEAVERLLVTSPPIDVIVTDRAMPGLSGDELAAIAQRVAPQVPVILLTGFGDVMLARGERPPGVAEVLSKPVRLEELRAALHRCGA